MYIEPNMQSSTGFTENMAVNYMAVHAKEGKHDWGTGSRYMQQALMSEIFV